MDPEELEEGLLNTSPEDIIEKTGFITDNGLLNLDFITDISLPNTGPEGGATMGIEAPHPYQIAFDKIGKIAKTGLTLGATAALYGANPLYAIAAHTPPSFFRLGAKKLGGGTLDFKDKLELGTDFISPTPLSRLVNKFVDIVFPGSTTLDED